MIFKNKYLIFIIKNKKAKNMATQKAFSSILDDKDFVDQSWNILDSTEHNNWFIFRLQRPC